MMQQSAESEIERPTILTFEPWKARTTSRSWPTRFSRKTENWVDRGPVPALHRLEVDLAAAAFAEAHGGPSLVDDNVSGRPRRIRRPPAMPVNCRMTA